MTDVLYPFIQMVYSPRKTPFIYGSKEHQDK